MSQSQTSTATISPRIRMVQAIAALGLLPVERISSTELASWAANLSRDGATLAESLAQLPDAHRTVLQAAAPDLLFEAHAAAASSVRAASQSDSARAARDAERARDLLHTAAARGTARLGRDERLATVGGIGTAMHDAGYTIRTHHGTRSSGLLGLRGHEVMLWRVLDGGGATVDQAGLGDGSCTTRLDDVLDRSRAYGIDAVTVSTNAHGSAAGGGLIRAAADVGGRNLARGAVLDFEQDAPVANSEPPTAVAATAHPAVDVTL